MLTKKIINIKGLHCKSCKTLIETEIDVMRGIKNVEVDFKNGKCKIEFDETKVSEKEIIKEIENLNYKVVKDVDKDPSTSSGLLEEKKIDKSDDKKFYIKIAWLILFLLGGYFVINKFGGFELLAQLNEGNVSYALILIIGILAGFHCVGMCGGFVVAYSASDLKNKKDEKKKVSILPHAMYNAGRIISYTVIGGILGGLGSFFGVNPVFTGTIMIVASVFMILMGLSFVSNWKILAKIKLSTPTWVAKYLYGQKHSKKPKGPFIIGLLTGLMPCGPLQAIQLYALASGDMARGALSMGFYAVGTALIMMIFGMVLSMISSAHMNKVVKLSGVFVIILGILMANRGLASFGLDYKVGKSTDDIKIEVSGNEEFQVVEMELNYNGYSPNVLYIKGGVPVRWVINVKQMSGCTNAIMIESLGIKKDLKLGENIIEFTPPTNVKEIKFSCWMRMVWGKFVVTEGDSKPSVASIEKEAESLPSGGSCDGNCGGSTCGASKGGSCGCGG